MEHTTQDGMVLKAGTRIYYSGDAANSEDEGAIERIYADKWGKHIVLKLDDRDTQTHLSPANFEPGPGRRFITIERFHEEHRAAIARMRADYEAQCKYVVKCDDCKTDIRRTHDIRESYAGGRCEVCS